MKEDTRNRLKKKVFYILNPIKKLEFVEVI